MTLDPWSVFLALVLSVFGFLVFLLWNKKYELSIIERKVSPAAKESAQVVIKNFLSRGEIPSKSKLISIMTSVAKKHEIQLLVHLPIQNIIDSLVYQVISNDLLDPVRKQELTDQLMKLRSEPISSEDYFQMMADNEGANTWKQKLAYSQLIKTLISSSILIAIFGLVSARFGEHMTPQGLYLLSWLLVSTMGFSVLIAGFTVLTFLSYLSRSKKKRSPGQDNIEFLSGFSRPSLLSSSNPANVKFQAAPFHQSPENATSLSERAKNLVMGQRDRNNKNKETPLPPIEIDSVKNLKNAKASELSKMTDKEASFEESDNKKKVN